MQCYRTSKVGGKASQVGGIASIIKVNESNLTVWYGGNPSKVAVTTNNIINIKLKILELKILVIENKTSHLQ